jgi:hypothetical protein
VHFDPRDIRSLRVGTEKGDLLDDLVASGPWRLEPHSLELRQKVFRAKRARELEFKAGESPIETYLALRRKHAGKRRRAASDIAQVQRERQAAAAAKPADDAPQAESSPSLPLVTGPIRGKSLRLIRGYSR